MLQFLFLLALFSSNFNTISSYGCKDQNNNDVDYFYAYKMPREYDNSIPGISDGVGFYYMDNHSKSFSPSRNGITSNSQAIAYTLQQYYDNQKSLDFFHVMYNDGENMKEDVEEYRDIELDIKGVKYGHTKGVVFFDKTDGFWLIHSIPNFPPKTAYKYPNSGTLYGQSILCISMNYDQLSKIGTQLYFNHPQIYSSNLPTSFVTGSPDLTKVIGGSYHKGMPYNSTLTLRTKGGQNFISFAKTAGFNQDLYQWLVAPSLQASLYVQTWRSDINICYPSSTKYTVYDIVSTKVGNTVLFFSRSDHSKIAISTEESKPYVCIGDINRKYTQFVRGGGTVCIESHQIWKQYFSTIYGWYFCYLQKFYPFFDKNTSKIP